MIACIFVHLHSNEYTYHRLGMKPIVAVIVFFSLMVPSLFLGYANYMTAKENIIEDVNQALVKTVLSSHPERITADTLRHCECSNLICKSGS